MGPDPLLWFVCLAVRRADRAQRGEACHPAATCGRRRRLAASRRWAIPLLRCETHNATGLRRPVAAWRADIVFASHQSQGAAPWAHAVERKPLRADAPTLDVIHGHIPP